MIRKGEERKRGESERPGTLGKEKGRWTKQMRQEPSSKEARGPLKAGGGVWAPQRWAGANVNKEGEPLSETKNTWKAEAPNNPAQAAGSWAVLCS